MIGKTKMSKYVSYFDAIYFFDGSFVEIPKNLVNSYEPYLLEDYDENFDPLNEVCQVFVTNYSEDYIETLKELFPSLRFKYFELLENWILLVDHIGTSWKHVEVEVNTKSKHFKKLKMILQEKFLK